MLSGVGKVLDNFEKFTKFVKKSLDTTSLGISFMSRLFSTSFCMCWDGSLHKLSCVGYLLDTIWTVPPSSVLNWWMLYFVHVENYLVFKLPEISSIFYFYSSSSCSIPTRTDSTDTDSMRIFFLPSASSPCRRRPKRKLPSIIIPETPHLTPLAAQSQKKPLLHRRNQNPLNKCISKVCCHLQKTITIFKW